MKEYRWPTKTCKEQVADLIAENGQSEEPAKPAKGKAKGKKVEESAEPTEE